MRIGQVLAVAFVVMAICGWIANIVKLIGLDFAEIGGEHIVRVAGIFLAPLGAVAGFF